MQQKLDMVESTNKRARKDEDKMFEDAKKLVYV